MIKTSGGKTAVFLYDQAGNLTAETDETGEILNEYIWLNGRLLASFKKDSSVEAFAEIAPDTLNINSKGTLTCFIELPEGYDIADIIGDSVTLNGTVHAEKTVVSDYNSNGIPDLTAKFDRQEFAAVTEPGDSVTVTVSGMVGSIPFAGTDTIKVIGKARKKSGAEAAVSYEPANTAKKTLYFYHTDHLGTPKLVTDINGNAVWKADYMPFGRADVSIAKTGSDFRFPGQIFDAETGLHYNWNRYYNPETGRYVTADPIGLAGGVNLYAYVLNDPVNAVDPSGLLQQDVDDSFNWIEKEFPQLTKNLEYYAYYPFRFSLFDGDGMAFGNRIIIDSYYKDYTLTAYEKKDLTDLIIHELLHLYVNEVLNGLASYVYRDTITKGGYHEWIYDKTSEISTWRDGCVPVGTKKPNLLIYIKVK